MDFTTVGAALGVTVVVTSSVVAWVIQRQDRGLRALREDFARERRGLERKVDEANLEAGVLMARAVSSAQRAERCAERAQRASDRSAIASELSAQRALEAGYRAQEAALWARLAGAGRARPVALRTREARSGRRAR